MFQGWWIKLVWMAVTGKIILMQELLISIGTVTCVIFWNE